ncbi:hypothetical protein ACHQM5_016906 [Ranunculus cassubicifolius]
MSSYRRILSILLILVFILGGSRSCHAASNVVEIKPKPPRHSNGFFYGYLPKAMPIPPSGPSKQHNSIGLESQILKKQP